MKYILRLFTILLFLFLTGLKVTQAQSLSAADLSNINVAALTDAQIRQIADQAKNTGLTDEQLRQLLQTKGMPDEQINNLQNRIRALASTSGAASPAPDTSGRRLNYTPDTALADGPQGLKARIFGADLFRAGNSFEPNLRIATPVNYILGPDDQVNINVYGNSLVDWKLVVSPEGTINIPGVGVVAVSGKTIEQATAIIKSRLAANRYAVGRGTNVNVSLGNIRSIKVIITGEAERPGTYTLPSLASAFNALSAAGGPNVNGSFRQIEIIRNNRIIRRLDIYDFLLKGDQKDNITLRDQDIIRIPTYRVRVEMLGEVKKPALFEVLPGETLQNVITFAGGFTDRAYTAKVKVTQISNQQLRISDVTEDDYKNYIPLRGDKFTVDAILDRYENRVTINGAVFRPGEYELENGLTLGRLITKAAGLKEDAFMDRGYITRLKSDNTTELVPFDLRAIVNKTAPDIALQREDVISIKSIFDLRDQYTVTINGEVRTPGDLQFAEGMTVEDAIEQAGGFTLSANAKRIAVARRINTADPRSANSPVSEVFSVDVNDQLGLNGTHFALKPYDIVSVYMLPGFEKLKTVRIEGEVVSPGNYTIMQKNERISDILKRAGGLTASGYAEGGTLKRTNAAILGVDKSRVDTNALEKERIQRLKSLQENTNGSSNVDENQLRNDYVGIDLKKIIDKPGSKTDLLIEDGDVIRIPKLQQVVRVNGEVLYPSVVVYDSGKSFKGYLINAGGFTTKASRRGAYVVYPNGTVKGTRKFIFFNIRPDVRPGSEIFVPERQQRRGLSLAEITAVGGSFSGLIAVILGLISITK
ncbi:SLBB domain-containing protein [Mucilaginibacter sp. Bleaf8]|uniref:SLBB domain-containing protein n=1 Tax=Mucilaginibacter sp. Bleaf8 TaxID=2834430 RepID=UPI001BD14DF2|nr:SLBB domain-containing protein [Mucilaginibacter sp. Bleaf8]MBS7562848.1 SLBB domain-containing protein [Mucilaginibacter sp. Bleaf8]